MWEITSRFVRNHFKFDGKKEKKKSFVKSLSLSLAQRNNGRIGTIRLFTFSKPEHKTNQGATRLAEHNMLANLLHTAL